MNKFYLYCNSGATAVDGEKGFVEATKPVVRKRINNYMSIKCNTTTEYAFALSFATQREAEDFNTKNRLPCIVLERRE